MIQLYQDSLHMVVSTTSAFGVWLVSQYDNIFAGIVASLIVLALQTFSHACALVLATFVEQRWRLRLLWRFEKPRRIFVVSGAITNVTENVRSIVLAGPDAEAASVMTAATGFLYPESEIKHVFSSHFPSDFYKDNLIVIGGPVNNQCAKLILDHGTLKDLFADYDLCMPAGTRYSTIYGENEKAVTDYGILASLTNPFDVSKRVMLVAGCDTHGVLASSIVASMHPDGANARKAILKKLGVKRYLRGQDYIAVVECLVLENEVAGVSLKELHLISQ